LRKKSVHICRLIENTSINSEVYSLVFLWPGESPKAGQFFMIKTLRGSTLLGRAIAGYTDQGNEQNRLRFLITRRGRGTIELSHLAAGEEVELIGPLGNAWDDFLLGKSYSRIALISGGLGIVPLAAFISERADYTFYFYAGFKKSFRSETEAAALLGNALNAEKLVVAFEDESSQIINSSVTGTITDFFDMSTQYDAVLACGPAAMLKTVKAICEKAALPCFISTENRMACGVGACLGCTIKTINGNRRCCADGPIFNAKEVIFDD
jgi:NAD(P)H-flavin reductase